MYTVFPTALDAHSSSSSSTSSTSTSPSNSISANANTNAKHLSHTPPPSPSSLGASSRNASSLLPQRLDRFRRAALLFPHRGTGEVDFREVGRVDGVVAPKPTPFPTPSSQSADQEEEKAERERPEEGAVEEMIVSGTGLLSAGLTLHPEGSVVAAGGRDVHGVCSGCVLDSHSMSSPFLVLMTFYGVVLHTTRPRRARIEARYPTGALWILKRAKILRTTNDPEAAIAVLPHGLEAPGTFVQADTLVRGFKILRVAFLCPLALVSSHLQTGMDAPHAAAASRSGRRVYPADRVEFVVATYCFIATGCYISLGNRDKAQELLDAVPDLLQRRKVGGKDLPSEVLIRKELEFYKEKQQRHGGDPARFIECISISTAHELGICRISDDVAKAHIAELAAMTPRMRAVSVHGHR
ncbi:hypothetical protein C8R45DRAFT_1096157 [Mycena sanguinolenta]|nr:hypothetical protein C8R45DRAFT_1096157 [Mycena sanguinolenta]